ncbi:MAG TPA: RNA-directed DNA polymerase, partial [Leptospiraceae bacterium]|nr:RNA-directed DNA polymerase [Leptospiraceae bacterium]
KVDDRTLKLIELFIRNEVISSVEEKESLTGIPAGVIYSHFFANIYLNDFDHRAQKTTLGYARYVDDICLVCGSLEELENVKKELSDYLDRWNQKFKEFEKTTIQPIFNIEPLLDHTRKMKYAARLDVVETYEESSEAISMVQETEKPFYRLYKIAEREGDLSQIVNQAGLVIALLKEEREADFADIIYSLLETHPVRPSTLKAALVYLLEIEHPTPSNRFMTFFFGEQKKSDYILTLFLRLLPHFDWDNNFKSEILSLCSSDRSYLIRATAFFTLSQNKILFSDELFTKMLLDERSYFVKSRLMECLRNIDKPLNPNKFLYILGDHELSASVIRSYVFLVENGDLEKEFINVLWANLKDKKVSPELLFYVLYLALLQGFYWVAEEILNIDADGNVSLVAP